MQKLNWFFGSFVWLKLKFGLRKSEKNKWALLRNCNPTVNQHHHTHFLYSDVIFVFLTSICTYIQVLHSNPHDSHTSLWIVNCCCYWLWVCLFFASCCPHRTMKCGIPILWLFNRNEITRMYIYYNSGYWSEVICNDKNRARCELLLHALIETPIAVIDTNAQAWSEVKRSRPTKFVKASKFISKKNLVHLLMLFFSVEFLSPFISLFIQQNAHGVW